MKCILDLSYESLRQWWKLRRIAVEMEACANKENMHIALTGGQLYKTGARKDIDFVVYHERHHRDDQQTYKDNFICHLHDEGFSNIIDHGFVTKCTYEGTTIDILYPEYDGENDNYPIDGDAPCTIDLPMHDLFQSLGLKHAPNN